jgi:hypothetical protein
MNPAALIIPLAALAALLIWKRTATLHERLFPGLYRSEIFPENRFPARNQAAFRAEVAAGYRAMREASVILCGLTKDDASTLPLTIRRIERTGEFFRDYRVVLFENDSRDATPALLKRWAAENPRVRVISESIAGTAIARLGRTERLAWCRNRYLDALRQDQTYRPFEYVIVADMDLGGGWSLDGLASSFGLPGWDVMASNSLGYHYLRRTYYDIYALEPSSVLKRGCLQRLAGEAWQLRRGDPPLPVRSAFGGLAIYRKDQLTGRRYSGSRNGRPLCEHRALNVDGRLKCFLNPSQITVTGTQEGKGYGPARPGREVLRKLFLNW